MVTAPAPIATASLPPVEPADNTEWVDEALAPFRAFIAGLAATAEPMAEQATGLRTTLESLRLSLPFEMDVRVGDDDRVQLAGAPPTQYTETTILPVFHRLSLNLESETAHG